MPTGEFLIEEDREEGLMPVLSFDNIQEEAPTTGEYGSIDKLKADSISDDKVSESGIDANSSSETSAQKADDDEFEDADATDWIKKAGEELTSELDFFGIKPELVADKDNFVFVKDQYEFVSDSMERDPAFFDLSQKISLPDDDLLFMKIKEQYGDLEDDEELLQRATKFYSDDNTMTERGKQIAENKRNALRSELGKKVEALKVESKSYAMAQHKFYKDLESEVKGLGPLFAKFKIGQEEIDLSSDVKLSMAEKRAIKEFLGSEYLQIADGTLIPNGKTKAGLIARNALLLNEKVLNSHMESLLAAAYKKGQSDYIAKNIAK